jgi:hypothetical protein
MRSSTRATLDGEGPLGGHRALGRRMNDLERGDVRQLLDALKRAEWADIRKDSVNCPVCHRPQAWGHVCSCPIKIALVKIGPRLLGSPRSSLGCATRRTAPARSLT